MPGDVGGHGSCRVGLLGRVELWPEGGGDPLSLSSRQRVAVAVLAAQLDRSVPADRLVEALWGDALPASPPAALRNVVSRLRRLLGGSPSPLVTEPAGYRLSFPADAVDAYRFEAVARRAEAAVGVERIALMDAALALWRGEAFQDIADQVWAQGEAVRLEALRDLVREQRARALLGIGRAEEAVPDLASLLTEQPQREGARALLMEALAAAGRHTDALDRYESWRHELAERGLEPSPELRDAQVRVLRHTSASAAVAERWRTSLPRPISSFVGREADLAALASLLERSRLVTLVGVGGVGKTRLAAAVAGQFAARYPDGAWFCDLSAASGDGDVVPIVATTIGVREQGMDPLPLQLARHLQAAAALVVMDNCERVLGGAAKLAETLTAHTAEVTVLATSRQRLAADGEVVHAVEPLPAIDTDSPATRLFADRRVALGMGSTDPADAPAMARICRKLDGLPLAIELAAARARGLTLAELERALDHRFAVLVDEHRTESRHRSLAAVIDWSYEELAPTERTVFRRLGVFRRSFDLDAAADLLAATGLDGVPVRSAVLTLVDRSLLRWTETPAGSRYSMLDSVREFAMEQLRRADELPAVSADHADWTLRLCLDAERGLDSADEAGWAARLHAHIDDMRAAVDTFVRHADDRALRMVSALHFFGLWRAESEIFRWANMATTALASSNSPWLPAAWAASGSGAWQRGDLAAARRAAERGFTAADTLDEHTRQRPLEVAGDVALLTGDLDRAIDYYSRGRELAIAAGDVSQAVWDEGSRALAHAYRGAPLDARDAGLAALRIAEETRGPTVLAYAHFVLGEIELDTNPATAQLHLARAKEHATRAGSHYVLALVDVSQASLASRAGDVRAALASYETVLGTWQKTGSWTGLAVTLRSLVTLLTTVGAAGDAALLYGAVAHPRTGPAPYGDDARRLAAAEANLLAVLGPQRFADLARRGRALNEDRLGDEALRAVREVALRLDQREG